MSRLHGGRFECDIFRCITLSENVNESILYSGKWFRLYMDERNNKHWGCNDFWYCPMSYTSNMTVLIYRVEEIWPPRADGWYAMRVVAWNRACLLLSLTVSLHSIYEAQEIWLTMADGILKYIYWKTIFSNWYSWTRLTFIHDCYVQKFATEQAIYHYVNQSAKQKASIRQLCRHWRHYSMVSHWW